MKRHQFSRVLSYTGQELRIKEMHEGANDKVKGLCRFGGLVIEEHRTPIIEVEVPDTPIFREALFAAACQSLEALDAEQRQRFEELYFPSSGDA